MRLIHCSDLHLDARMETHLPADRARVRKAELCDTFARMVDWAGENAVEAVLLAGDIFDSRWVSERTAALVLDIIAGAADVEFFCLRGNHDQDGPLFPGRTLPENLHMFGPQWTYYRRGDVVIAGMEPEGDGWLDMYDSLDLPACGCNIVVLHGQETARPGADCVALPRLRGKGIDYLALGHIHSYRREMLDDRGVWCYSGCLEGRGFDECGEKGFVLLDTAGGRVRSRFVPFASRQLREVLVDISGCTTVIQLQSAMEEASGGISPESLVKFTLVGTYTPQTQKDLTYLTGRLSRRFWFVRIKDDSRFRIERDSYAHDASLKGEFIRLVMASDRSEDEKARIICAGIRALTGEEVAV